jgi:hypothetical protein
MAGTGKPNGLKCEICHKPLTGKQRRVCSKECRAKLITGAAADRRALARQVAEHEVTQAVQTEVAEQVAPIVREALTEDILVQIQRFVHLIPAALDAVEKNLADEDADVRQKAATTLLRYTMGNPSVAPPSLEQTPAPLQIVFPIPRANSIGPARGGGIQPLLSATPASAMPAAGMPVLDVDPAQDDIDTCTKRTCMECSLDKCEDEFVGSSFRCKDCDRQLQERVMGEFGKVDLG